MRRLFTKFFEGYYVALVAAAAEAVLAYVNFQHHIMVVTALAGVSSVGFLVLFFILRQQRRLLRRGRQVHLGYRADAEVQATELLKRILGEAAANEYVNDGKVTIAKGPPDSGYIIAPDRVFLVRNGKIAAKGCVHTITHEGLPPADHVLNLALLARDRTTYFHSRTNWTRLR